MVHLVLILIRNAVAVGTYFQSPFSFWSTYRSQHMVIWSKPEVYFYPWMTKAVSFVWNWPCHHQWKFGAVPSIKKQKVDPRGPLLKINYTYSQWCQTALGKQTEIAQWIQRLGYRSDVILQTNTTIYKHCVGTISDNFRFFISYWLIPYMYLLIFYI